MQARRGDPSEAALKLVGEELERVRLPLAEFLKDLRSEASS